jgi:ferredoxin
LSHLVFDVLNVPSAVLIEFYIVLDKRGSIPGDKSFYARSELACNCMRGVMMVYRVSVDRLMCIACRVAPDLCPTVFALGADNGKNRLVEAYSSETSHDVSTGVIPDELYPCARKAAAACPVQAITVDAT